jgi:hypothetical protein
MAGYDKIEKRYGTDWYADEFEVSHESVADFCQNQNDKTCQDKLGLDSIFNCFIWSLTSESKLVDFVLFL